MRYWWKPDPVWCHSKDCYRYPFPSLVVVSICGEERGVRTETHREISCPAPVTPERDRASQQTTWKWQGQVTAEPADWSAPTVTSSLPLLTGPLSGGRSLSGSSSSSSRTWRWLSGATTPGFSRTSWTAVWSGTKKKLHHRSCGVSSFSGK